MTVQSVGKSSAAPQSASNGKDAAAMDAAINRAEENAGRQRKIKELEASAAALEGSIRALRADRDYAGVRESQAELAKVKKQIADLKAPDIAAKAKQYKDKLKYYRDELADELLRNTFAGSNSEYSSLTQQIDNLLTQSDEQIVAQETKVGMTLAHAETLVRTANLRASKDASGKPLDPDNTTRFNSTEALSTVYLNSNNREIIEKIAAKYNISPVLLAGVVAAEIDMDTQGHDVILDGLERRGFYSVLSEGLGVANVHTPSLEMAVKYLNEHNLPGAAEASKYPLLDVQTTRQYRATFEGSVEAAAIVTAMYNDAYKSAGHPQGAVTASDMATVWAAFRTGINGFSPTGSGFASLQDYQNQLGNGTGSQFPMGNNAYMSEPLFQFLLNQYSAS
jgi:hypothetical protein